MSFIKNLENVLLFAKEEQTSAAIEKLKEANVILLLSKNVKLQQNV